MSLRLRLLLFSFADEFGPLYALYAVWFTHNGLSAADVSWVFLLWALVGLVAEVPSGALADLVDRRRLIAFSLLLRAVGISIWLAWPSFTGIVVGAALWATHSAFASGTWEALIHDQLAARGEADDYGSFQARIGQASHAAVALGILSASGLITVGMTIRQLGWMTVAMHALSMSLILSLPAVDRTEKDEALSLASWWRTLVLGVRESVHDAERFRLVTIGTLLSGLFILDEYQPLLAQARGVSDAGVPFYVFAVWAGLLLGGEVAARRPGLSGRTTGALLIGASLVVIAALLSARAWPLVLLGVGYGAQNIAWIIVDARMQKRIPSRVRATINSVRAFFGMALSLLCFALVGVASAGADPTVPLLGALALLAVTGGLLVRWSPAATSGRTEPASR